MRPIGYLGLALGAGVMAVFAAGLLIWRYLIASAFVSSGPVIALSAQLFIVAAIFQIVDGIQVTAISGSAERPRFAYRRLSPF